MLIGVERRVITASLCNDARVAAGPEHTGRSPVRSRPGYKAAGSQRYDCQSADERAESHLTRDSQSAAVGHESRCNIFRCLLTLLTDIEIYFTCCAIRAAVQEQGSSEHKAGALLKKVTTVRDVKKSNLCNPSTQTSRF